MGNKLKVLTVVGARPQFIKAATVSRIFAGDSQVDEVIIHTGQHYDYNMSEVFFKEMGIPEPGYNLGISGMTHAQMTGNMMIALEPVLESERPDLLLVYGDTNSTLAAALTAVKMHIPVCHVEAGNRLGTLNNPEEVNRILTDHVSSILCACVDSSVNNLLNENLTKNVCNVGDPMLDAFGYYTDRANQHQIEDLTDLSGEPVQVPSEYYYLTCHREENTSRIGTLAAILDAMQALDAKCIYPVHPRNRKDILEIIKTGKYGNVLFCNPVGYLTSVYLVNHSKKVITDSGGLQREAFFAKKPCVTIFDYVVWPETMKGDANQLAKANKEDILEKLSRKILFDESYKPFGDGHAAEKIVAAIREYLR